MIEPSRRRTRRRGWLGGLVHRRRANGRRADECRGATIVEAALVLPIVLLFLFGIMEYGRFLFMLQMFTNAAREGCRYAVAHTEQVTLGGTVYGCNTSDVTNQIAKFLGGQQLANQNMQVYLSDSQGNNQGVWTNAQPGQYIGVQITGNYTAMVPSLLSMPSSIPITARAVMVCEGD
jgi:Flp pilus assembly protein TadG